MQEYTVQHNTALNQKAFDWFGEAEIPSVDVKYHPKTFGNAVLVAAPAPALSALLLQLALNKWTPAFTGGLLAGAGACLWQCSGWIKDFGVGEIPSLLVSKVQAS